MANVAETLSAMHREAWEDGQNSRLRRGEAAACESGARCYEIVARLAALEPAFHYRDVDPLVEQARTFVTGREER